MNIELTLEQLQKFLGRIGSSNEIRDLALKACVPVLEDTLRRRVFTYEEGNVTIASKAELEKLIRSGGRSHTPGKAPKGKPYDKHYLERKAAKGIHMPHVWENYSFWDNTDIRFDKGCVVMETKMSPTAEKDFNYLAHHEERRSVLKTTFLLSWQEIVETILETYADEAKNG